MKLSEIARVIRSKNAGPFELTLDVFFEDEAGFERARRSLDAARIARLYGVRSEDVLSVHFYRPALAFKATLARSLPAGSPGDRDVFGAQQHAPLLSLDID